MRANLFKNSRIESFVRDERGSYSVEFVIWFPLFVFLFVIMFGFSLGMIRQTMILNEMNRVARAYGVGTIATLPEAKEEIDAYITASVMHGYESINSTVTLIDRDDIVEVKVNIPLVTLIPILSFGQKMSIIEESSLKMAAYYHVENH